MARPSFILCFALVALLFGGCKKDEWTLTDNTPLEKTFLLFPGTQKSITLRTRQYLEKVDVGLDFDIPADAISLTVISKNRKFQGVKIPGTFMPLVVCNVPVADGRVSIKIDHRSLAKSAWAAIRIAPSISKMCAPTTPIWDDYVVELPR